MLVTMDLDDEDDDCPLHPEYEGFGEPPDETCPYCRQLMELAD